MARYSIEDTTLTNIANAIRNKTNNTNPIAVSDMADEISGISGGELVINGIIREYEVNTGASVSAGDFVEFVNKFGNGDFNPANSYYLSACKLDNSRVLVAYCDYGNSYVGTAVVLSFDGTTVRVGTEKVFYNKTSQYISVAALTESKVLVACCGISGNADKGIACVLTVGDKAVTAGPMFTFNTSVTAFTSVTKLTDSKVLVAYKATETDEDNNTTNYGRAVVLTIDGTVITVGTNYTFRNGNTNYIDVAALNETKAIVSYYGSAEVLTLDGTTITGEGASVIFNAGTTAGSTSGSYKSIIPFTATNVLIAYAATGVGRYTSLSIDDTTITIDQTTSNGTKVQKATSNLHNVGIAKTSGASGETVEVYCPTMPTQRPTNGGDSN